MRAVTVFVIVIVLTGWASATAVAHVFAPIAPNHVENVRRFAIDHSAFPRGWLAVNESVALRVSLPDTNIKVRAISAFLVIGIGIVLTSAGLHATMAKSLIPGLGLESLTALWPLMSVAMLAAAGYVLFWIWFASPAVGAAVSWAVVLAGCWLCFQRRSDAWRNRWTHLPLALATLVGFAYLLLLFAYPAQSVAKTAATRFAAGMPCDNETADTLAQRLANHERVKPFFLEWLSSDRPPLQSGWDLLWWPPLRAIGIDFSTGAQISGVWLQLSWVSALWAIAQTLGLRRSGAVAVILGTSVLGLVMFNTVYVWPKLSAAAFLIGAAVLALSMRGNSTVTERWPYAAIGALIALACLSHGAAAFAVLGLVGFAPWLRHQWRRWLIAGGVCVMLVLPWLAYQRFYDPPGNRLLKWHLAGVVPIDDRTLLQALRDQYREVGIRGALQTRLGNLRLQTEADWAHLLRPESSQLRRYREVSFYLRSAGIYLGTGIVAWLLILVRRKITTAIDIATAGGLLMWALATWFIWLALMFQPNSTLAHQGSYVVPLVLYGLLLTAIVAVFRRSSWIIIAVQAYLFFATWSAPASAVS